MGAWLLALAASFSAGARVLEQWAGGGVPVSGGLWFIALFPAAAIIGWVCRDWMTSRRAATLVALGMLMASPVVLNAAGAMEHRVAELWAHYGSEQAGYRAARIALARGKGDAHVEQRLAAAAQENIEGAMPLFAAYEMRRGEGESGRSRWRAYYNSLGAGAGEPQYRQAFLRSLMLTLPRVDRVLLVLSAQLEQSKGEIGVTDLMSPARLESSTAAEEAYQAHRLEVGLGQPARPNEAVASYLRLAQSGMPFAFEGIARIVREQGFTTGPSPEELEARAESLRGRACRQPYLAAYCTQ